MYGKSNFNDNQQRYAENEPQDIYKNKSYDPSSYMKGNSNFNN